MVELLLMIEITGGWILFVAVIVFVLTLIALATYTLLRGERDDADIVPSVQPFGPHVPAGRSGITLFKGRYMIKRLGSRSTFITMESLVNGAATREQWFVVAGIQVFFISFWLIFLGFGLMYVLRSNGFSLFFPAVVGLWLFGIMSAQLRDLKRARKKAARSHHASRR